MGIVLATSETADDSRVVQALNDLGIGYNTQLVENYQEPRLRVGAVELLGVDDILAALPALSTLARD